MLQKPFLCYSLARFIYPFNIDENTMKPEQIINIANLSKLTLSEAQTQGYTQDLTRIIEMVDTLEKVDTTDITPMAHPLDATQRLRADVVEEKDQHELFQSIAPNTEDAHYLVPKVVE